MSDHEFTSSFLKSLMGKRNETVWAVDRQFKFKYFNNSLLAVFFEGDDVSQESSLSIGADALAGVEGEEKEFWYKKYSTVLDGKKESFEHVFLRDNGKTYYTIEMNLILVRGKVVGVSCFANDITEKRKVMNDLKNSDDLLRIFASNLMGVAFILDKDGVFRLSQGKGLKKLGLEPNQVVGQSVFDVYKDNPDIIDSIRKCLAGEDLFSRVVKAGPLIFDSNFQTLYDEEGKISGMLGVSIDITERTRVEGELEENMVILRHMEKMQALGQLAGGVAHDFNNQLMGISGFAELIGKEVKGNPILEKYVRNIIDAVDHSSLLASQLLTFARKGKSSFIPVDMHRLIDKMISILNHTIDKKIDIILELLAEKHCIKGDESELYNCLLNMAINSRDAMAEGGRLTIRTENRTLSRHNGKESISGIGPGDYFVLTIADTGCGIDKAILKRIFEPFFTTKDIKKGTGMGLSMVYGAVKKHKGNIRVESEPGAGTEFQIFLPLFGDESHPKG